MTFFKITANTIFGAIFMVAIFFSSSLIFDKNLVFLSQHYHDTIFWFLYITFSTIIGTIMRHYGKVYLVLLGRASFIDSKTCFFAKLMLFPFFWILHTTKKKYSGVVNIDATSGNKQDKSVYDYLHSKNFLSDQKKIYAFIGSFQLFSSILMVYVFSYLTNSYFIGVMLCFLLFVVQYWILTHLFWSFLIWLYSNAWRSEIYFKEKIVDADSNIIFEEKKLFEKFMSDVEKIIKESDGEISIKDAIKKLPKDNISDDDDDDDDDDGAA